MRAAVRMRARCVRVTLIIDLLSYPGTCTVLLVHYRIATRSRGGNDGPCFPSLPRCAVREQCQAEHAMRMRAVACMWSSSRAKPMCLFLHIYVQKGCLSDLFFDF